MILYILLFFPLAWLSIMESSYKFKRKDSILVSFIFLFIFWTLSWLRWERGTDWGNYYNFFKDYATNYNLATNSGFEWGFATINYIIRSFTDDYTILLFSLACLFYPFAGYAICQTSTRPITTTFVAYTLNSGFIFFTRQGIVVGILLLSVYFIFKRKKIFFLLLIFYGCLFHTSALLFLPAYWIFHKRIKTQTLIIILAISVPVAIALNKFLLGLMTGIPGFIGVKIANYLESGGDFAGFGQSVYRVIAGGLINRGGILIVALIILGKNRINNAYANGIINLYALGFILFMMTAPITVSLTRIAEYYNSMGIFIIPILFNYLQSKQSKMLCSVLFVAYLSYRFFIGSLHGPYGELYVPFNSIFTKEKVMKIG